MGSRGSGTGRKIQAVPMAVRNRTETLPLLNRAGSAIFAAVPLRKATVPPHLRTYVLFSSFPSMCSRATGCLKILIPPRAVGARGLTGAAIDDANWCPLPTESWRSS